MAEAQMRDDDGRWRDSVKEGDEAAIERWSPGATTYSFAGVLRVTEKQIVLKDGDDEMDRPGSRFWRGSGECVGAPSDAQYGLRLVRPTPERRQAQAVREALGYLGAVDWRGLGQDDLLAVAADVRARIEREKKKESGR